MTNLEARLAHLEQLVSDQANQLARLWSAVWALQQAVRVTQLGGFGGGGSGGQIYYIAPVVIANGGNVTGQTVYVLVGGSPVTVTTGGVVYNIMAVATVATAGKNIIVAPCGDGTYLAVTQSC